MTPFGPNGRPAQLIREQEQARRDAQILLTGCLHCDWTFDGLAGQGREAHAAHRALAHPEVKPRRIRRSTPQRFHEPESTFRDEGIRRAAETAAILARREAAA